MTFLPTFVSLEGVIQTLEPYPTILQFGVQSSSLPEHKGSHTINKRPILRNDFPFLLPNQLSGKLWKWLGGTLKGQPSGTHLPRGCGRRFGPSWASRFNLGPQRYPALTQQGPPLTLAPGTILGTAPTGWRVRGHLFSDQRFYPSETCQRNTRLNGASGCMRKDLWERRHAHTWQSHALNSQCIHILHGFV